jgi:hypothetical protein
MLMSEMWFVLTTKWSYPLSLLMRKISRPVGIINYSSSDVTYKASAVQVYISNNLHLLSPKEY